MKTMNSQYQQPALGSSKTLSQIMKSVSTSAVTLLTLQACATSSRIGDTAPATSRAKDPAIHVFESDAAGFNTRTIFYDSGSEVVAFDSQFTPDLAKKSIDFLRTKTSSAITYLVITHPNPDKFNGISAFREAGAQVVASKATANGIPVTHAYKKYFFVNMAKMFTEETYPKLDKVDVVFETEMKLKLKSGEALELRELSSPGISTNQTVALVPKANALIVGDLVHHGVHAWLEGGIRDGKAVPTLAGWIRDLNEIRALYSKTAAAKGEREGLMIYGGRGEAAPLEEAVTTQIAYLKTADRLVTDYVRELGERKSELTGAAAGSHHAELTKRFEKTFPDYGLSYMIQYGVYGLANSK